MSGSVSDYRPTQDEAYIVFDLIERSFRPYGKCFVVGSLSRAKRPGSNVDRVGDIDIVVSPKGNCAPLILSALGCMFGWHKNGSPKTIGCIGKNQVDFFLANDANCGAVRLFYELPRQLQIALRAIAAARGYKFGPKGLKNRKTNEVAYTPSKSDVYEILGVKPFDLDELERGAAYIFREKLW